MKNITHPPSLRDYEAFSHGDLSLVKNRLPHLIPHQVRDFTGSHYVRWISFILCILLLNGCMSVATTSAQAVYNRRNLQNTLDDNYISMRSERAIYLDTKAFEDTHVAVSAFNGTVLLTGQTPTTEQRQQIEAIVRKIADNPPEFYNQITISSPTSAITRTSDAWITTKIKTQFIAANEIDPSQIKVVTENGTVFLIGVVTHQMGDVAIDIARKTDGVQKVITVFQWIHISKT
ncbi:MAG: BON domain-containing protein [Gammaproteobacteria bacterium]|nr:BON domain-containing protein [Gammaproteobacteria bacterium]